jgi:nucleotide-binding universal stress UspA family protein
MKSLQIKTILIPIDFSDTAMKALDYAIYMAKMNNAKISLLHVTDEIFINSEYAAATFNRQLVDEQAMLNQNIERLSQLGEQLRREGILEIEPITKIGGLHSQIVEVTKEQNIDLIIMGTHGVSGFQEFLIGSNTFRVVEDAKCPVLSVQHHSRKAVFENILVPFTDRPHSREKVEYAVEMAELYNAKIHILAIDLEDNPSDYRKMLLRAEQVKKIVEHRGIAYAEQVVTGGEADKIILDYVQQHNVDLIVMSDLNTDGLTDYFLGPLTQKIVNHSPIPVLSIPPMYNANSIDLHGYGW